MKRNLAIIIMAVMVLTIAMVLGSCEPAHTHVLTKCGGTEATCTQEGSEVYYVCDECGEMFSDAEAQKPIEAPVSIEKIPHVDLTKDHECDICGSKVGEHKAAEGKHTCDFCNKPVTECVDFDKDHKCDVCKGAVGVHEAAKGKHTCGYCGDVVTKCEDNDNDHACDVCYEILSYCADEDKDHACDLCGEYMGVHESAEGGHSCDYCGGPVTDCIDEDYDHKCDICEYPVGEHVEGYGHHYCEYCWTVVSNCHDDDKNHECDHCFESMGVHKPAKGGHFCDYCGYRFTDCVAGADDNDCTTPVYCTICNEIVIEAKEHSPEWHIDGDVHWYECINEGCEYVSEDEDHYRFSEGKCVCGLTCQIKCDVCDLCNDLSCVLCNNKCLFIDTNKVVPFAPSIVLGAPEGPDGQANGYNYDTSITAQQVVLSNGAFATLVTLPNGTTANSGVSFLNNQNHQEFGKLGYNCGIPLIDGQFTVVRLYFTNNGSADISIKYSNIDYYYDYGAVTLTLKPGETKAAIIKTSHGDSIGLNSQVVFTENVAAGTSLSIYGEFVADSRMSSISIATPANKLSFVVGETFSAEGLVLKAGGTKQDRVFISGNYKTDLDGYTFTADDVGLKPVVVKFNGLLLWYAIEIIDHVHNVEYVPEKAPVACEQDGFEAHYACTICGDYFTDATGNKPAGAPKAISCHTVEDETKVLPGHDLKCSGCGEVVGQRSMENWVIFNLPTGANIGSNIVNGKIEAIDYNGIPATKFSIGAGTKGATNNSSFHLMMSENEGDRQTVIPHVRNGSGYSRTIMFYYQNLSDVQIVMNLQNDRGGAHGVAKATVPANGSTIVTLNTSSSQNGSNWYNYYVDFNPSKDVSFVVYGYMYVNPGEIDTPTIRKSAEKLTYKVGETFTSKGLILHAPITGVTRPIYASTGYTTNFDGYTFTADDLGSQTVAVSLAGKTTYYQIDVIEDIKCDEGIHEWSKIYDESLFVKMDGDDAIYKYKCAYCNAVSTETYVCPKVAFVPHNKGIDNGHTIEYVTLEDGRIAAKLTINSNVSSGSKITTIESSGAISGTNVFFPVSGNGRRVYMEMTSSADIGLRWQPEFYGDMDGVSMELKAGEAQGKSWIIKYDANSSYTSSNLPYEEFYAESDIPAGTEIYITGYFYEAGSINGVFVDTLPAKTVFMVGETFSSEGLSLIPSSSDSLFGNVRIFNVTTDYDNYVFTEKDIGKFITVTVSYGDYSTTYDIVVAK